MRRGFDSGVFPETVFIFGCFTGFDVREEDGFRLRVMNLGRFREVELNHALKFTEKGLLDEILGSVVVSVLINEAFILQRVW